MPIDISVLLKQKEPGWLSSSSFRACLTPAILCDYRFFLQQHRLMENVGCFLLSSKVWIQGPYGAQLKYMSLF